MWFRIRQLTTWLNQAFLFLSRHGVFVRMQYSRIITICGSINYQSLLTLSQNILCFLKILLFIERWAFCIASVFISYCILSIVVLNITLNKRLGFEIDAQLIKNEGWHWISPSNVFFVISSRIVYMQKYKTVSGIHNFSS